MCSGTPFCTIRCAGALAERGDEMSATLAQLCESIMPRYGMKPAAGQNGMDNIVRWVHIIEDPETLSMLRGGELVITSGVGRSGTQWLAGFIGSLRNAGAVGAAIVVGANIPAVPDDVTKFCEETGFPLFTLEAGADILDISYELCRRITGSEKHESAVNDALKALISDPSALRSYHKILTRSEFLDDSTYTAVTVYGFKGGIPSAGAGMALRRNVKNTASRSALFVYKGLMAAIFQNGTDNEIKSFCKCACDVFEDNIYIGVSDPVTGIAGIAAAYEQSEAALVSSILGEKEGNGCGVAGVVRLITGVKDRKILREYVKEQLGVIIEYDREHGTDLARTLRIYLENNSSVNEVASIVKVHRNTVNGKIRTVRELIGHELDDVSKSRLILAYLVGDVLRVYDEKLNPKEA